MCSDIHGLEAGRYQSGQMGQTVTLLSQDFEGSNPSPPTRVEAFQLILEGFFGINTNLKKKPTLLILELLFKQIFYQIIKDLFMTAKEKQVD